MSSPTSNSIGENSDSTECPSNAHSVSCNILILRPLMQHITATDLAKYFNRFGTVVKLTILMNAATASVEDKNKPAPTKFAVIVYDNVESACEALKSFSPTSLQLVPLIIGFCPPLVVSRLKLSNLLIQDVKMPKLYKEKTPRRVKESKTLPIEKTTSSLSGKPDRVTPIASKRPYSQPAATTSPSSSTTTTTTTTTTSAIINTKAKSPEILSTNNSSSCPSSAKILRQSATQQLSGGNNIIDLTSSPLDDIDDANLNSSNTLPIETKSDIVSSNHDLLNSMKSVTVKINRMSLPPVNSNSTSASSQPLSSESDVQPTIIPIRSFINNSMDVVASLKSLINDVAAMESQLLVIKQNAATILEHMLSSSSQ